MSRMSIRILPNVVSSVTARYLLCGFTILPFLTQAQPVQKSFTQADGKQLMTSARTADTAVKGKPVESPSISTAPATPQVTAAAHVLPLFGERPKTAEQIGREIQFLNECDQNFTSRQEASQFFSARGWDYLSEGQLDTAAYRFNLSWLLNDKNSDAYWGLGVVSYQRNDLPQAVRMLKKGLNVADTNVVLMTDLATVQIRLYQEKQDLNELNDAESLLQKSLTIVPNNPNAFVKLALVNYERTEYAKAWEYFHKARILDISVIDLTFLNELLSKQPDPQGVFK
ncbi:tetratricopeptide repeat protein [Nibrella viscosa]